MADSVYRTTEVPKNTEKTPEKVGDTAGIQTSDVEVPFTEYQNEHKHPYIVDHFKLGDTWQDALGGFDNEVKLIENYFKDEIGKGNIQNDVSSVKTKLDKIYKMCGIDKSERTTMQIEKLAAYLEFLKKTDHIITSNQKYGRQDK